MFRRSLSVLVLLSLLGLVMVLIYAAWNRSAAPDALARAAALLGKDRPRDALVILNHTDRSLGPKGDPELRVRLHLLRARAREETGRFQHALDDVRTVQNDFGRRLDPEQRLDLRRAEVRLLVACGKTDPSKLGLGLERARSLLADDPDDTETLELAGRIVQTRYTKELDEIINDSFPVHFGAASLDGAVKQLLTFLYREPDDPAGIRRQKAFEQDLRARIADEITLDEITTKIRDVQRQIRASGDYYRHALRGQKAAFTAFQGYTGMLLRGGRLDEAALLSWLYLERFPSKYGSVIAAGRAMESFLRMDNPELAVAAGKLWLGPAGVAGLLARFDVDDRLVDACALYTRSCWRIHDAQRTAAAAWALAGSDSPLVWPTANFLLGLTHDLSGAADRLEEALGYYCQAAPRRPPREGADLLEQAFELRLAWAERRKNRTRVKRILGSWIEVRPDDPRPHLERARLLLDEDKPWLAARDANDVLGNDDVDPVRRDAALLLLLHARDVQHARDHQDSTSLFTAIMAAGGTAPASIRDPVFHIGIAKIALEKKAYGVARANAREAATHFPWSAELRRLQARCHVALGEDPLYDIEQALASEPDDLEARLLQVQALAGNAAPTLRRRQAELELMTRHPERLESALLFAEHLLHRRAFRLCAKLCRRLEGRGSDGARWLRGRALLSLGAETKAIDELRAVSPSCRHRAGALAAALETAARIPGRTDLAALRRELVDCRPGGKILRRVAQALVREGQLADAYELLHQVDQRPEMKRERNGKLYVLLGKIRHAMGHALEARGYWDYAFPFEDGGEAAPLLALSYLLEGDAAQAGDALRYAPKPEGDPLILAYLYYLRGDPEKARKKVREFETPSRLLKAVLVQALDLAIDPKKKPSRSTPFPWINDLVASKPGLLFEALALAPGLAFEERSRDALAKLEAGATGKDAFDRASMGLIRAYRDLLARRKRQAWLELLGVVHGAPLFFPAYDDLIRLGEELHPKSLFQLDMLNRYFGLATKLPPEMLARSRFGTIWFRGLASIDLAKGDYGMAENWLIIAHAAAPADAAPLRLLAEAARRRGDYEAALGYQGRALELGSPSRRRRDAQVSFEMGLEASELAAGRDPRTKLGGLVGAVVASARAWLAAPPTAEHPPLGSAAVLLARSLPDSPDAARSARKVLEDCLAPYADGRLPPRLDLPGIRLALEELRNRGAADRVLDLVTRVLTFDPSLVDLWIWRAGILEQRGNANGAIRSLAWLPELLPGDATLLAELGRLCGSYPGVDRGRREKLLATLGRVEQTPQVAVAKALLTLRTGRPAEAVRLFDAIEGDLGRRAGRLRDMAGILAGEAARRPAILARMQQGAPHASAGVVAAQLRWLARPGAAGEADHDAAGTGRDEEEEQARNATDDSHPVPAGTGK